MKCVLVTKWTNNIKYIARSCEVCATKWTNIKYVARSCEVCATKWTNIKYVARSCEVCATKWTNIKYVARSCEVCVDEQHRIFSKKFWREWTWKAAKLSENVGKLTSIIMETLYLAGEIYNEISEKWKPSNTIIMNSKWEKQNNASR